MPMKAPASWFVSAIGEAENGSARLSERIEDNSTADFSCVPAMKFGTRRECDGHRFRLPLCAGKCPRGDAEDVGA